MDEQIIISRRVCVAGASGRIGSWLVMKLLERGHIVHATIRNLCDPVKTGLLRSLPGADSRLLLFEADLFQPHQLQQAIQGCDFVFLVAFPTQPFRNHCESEAAGEAVLAMLQSILSTCERSGTVKRLIYTGSVATASPLDEDGLVSRDSIDESCWTRPDVPIVYPSDYTKLLLEGEKSPLEVVVLTCGVVGGEALVESLFGVGTVLSPLTGDTARLGNLTFLQDLLCSVPLVHLDDVCEAHLFCMDVPLTGGRRFLCATDYPSMWDIIAYHRLKYSDLLVAKEPEGRRIRITGGSTRLRDMGFEYKYSMEQILDDSVRFAKKLGLIKDT